MLDSAPPPDHLRVESATGVDLKLLLAGPGSRSYAFVIDWHIRALLACLWLLVAAYGLHFDMTVKSSAALLSVLPAAVLYFLYHPIVEVAMRGRTPGKRMAGVVIVDRRGGTPGTAALLIRNIFRLVDSLPAFYLVGLGSCFISAERVRIGDMAAGTLLVIEDGAARRALLRVQALTATSDLPLETLELVDQLIERWPALTAPRRAAIARNLIMRIDPACGPELGELQDGALLARLRRLRDGHG